MALPMKLSNIKRHILWFITVFRGKTSSFETNKCLLQELLWHEAICNSDASIASRSIWKAAYIVWKVVVTGFHTYKTGEFDDEDKNNEKLVANARSTWINISSHSTNSLTSLGMILKQGHGVAYKIKLRDVKFANVKCRLVQSGVVGCWDQMKPLPTLSVGGNWNLDHQSWKKTLTACTTKILSFDNVRLHIEAKTYL